MRGRCYCLAASTLFVLSVQAFVLEPPASQSTALYAEKQKRPVPTRSKLTPAQRLLRKNAEELNQNEAATGTFDKVKEVVYSVGDGVDRITKPKAKTDKVFDGYQGARYGKSPTQQLLQNTLQRGRPSAPVPRSAKQSSGPKPSVFDNVKEKIYGTADLVSNAKKSSESKPPIQRIAVGPEFKPVAKERIVPDSVRDSLPDLDSNNPLRRTAAELKIRDAELKENARKTKQTIDSSVEAVKEGVYGVGEFLQSTATAIERLPDRIRNLAEAVVAFFKVIPVAVQETIDVVTAIPETVEQKATQAKKSVSETVDKTVKVVDEVKAIPSKVQQTAENTAKTAKDAVDKTVQVVNDVKAIPSRVQQTAENTKKTVDDIAFNTKVLLGKEKPRPPPPPPPPKDASEMAWRIAGSLVKGTGQVAWWVTKGTAQLGWKAVALGVDKAKEQITEKQKPPAASPSKGSVKPPAAPPKPSSGTKAATTTSTKPRTSTPTTTKEPPKPYFTSATKPEAAAAAATPPKVEPKSAESKPPEPVSLAEKNFDDEELDSEIAEALEAAESALKETEASGKTDDEDKPRENSKEKKN